MNKCEDYKAIMMVERVEQVEEHVLVVTGIVPLAFSAESREFGRSVM